MPEIAEELARLLRDACSEMGMEDTSWYDDAQRVLAEYEREKV